MTTPPTPDQVPGRTVPVWLPWLLAMVFFSLAVALAVGILTSLSGAGGPEAVLAGGAAFGGAMGLCLAGVVAVRELRQFE
ncbi:MULTISPECIES: hypothetical protein [Streptomyces]|uniref:Uncharacterized protein n=1 Tax=Streptomyces lycii TaxID=2654337 RepID=A0ABQ7F9N0_9ACTN|nr:MULTISPECIES: hypothetical protein [Streptomyces]KAF4405375.1 hypothetical protein GCU69_30390 [Streptomyces lycii]PGH49946.1 hypothetical protein CRI70_14870 [Streptomyces sp. Ru87]